MTLEANSWNSDLYQSHYSFVWRYGRDLVQLLMPKEGERILDVGCGTGQLTAEIANAGADVIGIDASPEMIQAARKNFPKLRFEVCDATTMGFDQEFDAVFSNAALHWVLDQENAVACISRALQPGGRFVFEMGGRGNILEIWNAGMQALRELGIVNPERFAPWHYPTLGEYAGLLESKGIAVTFAVLFDRPTALEGGEKGLENWLRMFAKFAFDELPAKEHPSFVRRVEELAKPKLFQNGVWMADHKRLRMLAAKQ